MQSTKYPILCSALGLMLLAGIACDEAQWGQWDWNLGGKAQPVGEKAAPAPTPGPASDSLAAPGSAFTASHADARDGNGMVVLRVHFDVLRVDIPVDAVRHSLKIWNHIDESLGDPGLTALLARNGFRVGKSSQAEWPAIRTIFEHNGARVSRVARTVQEGAPLTVPLGKVEDGASYFLHKRGGGLGGGTLTAGRRTFLIDYAVDPNDPQRLVLRATPAFQEEKTHEKLVERDGEIVSVRDQEGRVFYDLSVETALSMGDFLVIGGSEPAEKGFVLGSWWLDSSLDMQQYETVLCISAQATRVE
ncbi:MAG: hypothetical protein H6817_10055 [Phycisphaerales bacterium]|nr:hypothetical protein [Phycisphaerales bacterium]